MRPRKQASPAASSNGARSRRISINGERPASRVSVMLLGNDSWELFEGIPKHYSLRTRVRMKMQLSKAGFIWEMCQTLFAIVASGLYVIQTYQPDFDTNSFDVAALVVFSFDYILNFYAAESRWWFVISFMSIMDIVTIIPSLVDRVSRHDSGSSIGNSFPFLRFIRVLRLLRLMRLIRAASSRSTSAVQKQIHTIVLLITCIVFISAGIFHAVESANRLPTDPIITFGDSLYFLVVTMSTVGYGDVSPLTSYGKVAAAAVIIVSFTILPMELSRLTQLMGLQSQFRRFYHPSVGNPHILIIGHISDARLLLDFFKEFYHPDRQTTDIADPTPAAMEPLTDSPCVLMGPDEPSEAIVNLLDHPLLQGRVTYLKGSVMSEEDLCRVGADTARACFVLVPKSSENAQATDTDTVLRLLAIRNYNADLEVYTQMVSPAYSDYISEMDADHVLCINEIKLSLMAKSCLCPGLVTLVSNLFRSSSITSSAAHAYTGWKKEYVEGLAMEVYAAKLPPPFYGLSFAQACGVLYQCFNGEVIMLGVFEPSPSDEASGHHEQQRSVPKMVSTLPNLKVQTMRPAHRMSHPSTGTRASQMYINPGHDVSMRAGQIVYILSESKQLTHVSSIMQHLDLWLSNGNKIPPPKVPNAIRDQPASPIEHGHIAIRLLAVPSTPRPRTESEILIEEAVHPLSGRAIENHIIVVSDLDLAAMQTFVKLLRLRHHVPGRSEYHKIIFLSWANASKVSSACRVLQAYDDVFLMMARDSNSRTEFSRANILRAARCVLLSDKSSITQLDGEAVDSQTIFHYLAILSIQSEFGVDTTCGLMPIVELTMPRTMKILDSALTKRTLRSFLHRQKINAIIRRNSRDKTGPLNPQQRGRRWTKKFVPQLVQQGTSNFSSMKNSIMLRKSLQLRLSSLRQQDTTTNRSTSFDATGTALLPFFAAGYGFSDDVFDNMLCQSYFTPRLVRFIYALIFTENGLAYRRPQSTLGSLDHSDDLGNMSGEDLGVDDDDEEEEEVDEDDDFDSGDGNDEADHVVASSIVQVAVPSEFVSSTFGELFLHLLAELQVVAIALYRGRSTPFSLPYVATGPSVETVLMKDDLVFVLAQPAAHEILNPSLKGHDATRVNIPSVNATSEL